MIGIGGCDELALKLGLEFFICFELLLSETYSRAKKSG